MNKLILLLTLTSLSVSAEQTKAQAELEARCLGMAIIAEMRDSIISMHKTNAYKVLTERDVMFELGYVQGYLKGITETDKEEKEVASKTYSLICLSKAWEFGVNLI